MDELEFRRRVLAKPQHLDQELTQAQNASSANSKFVDDVLHLDDQINAAMQIDVPDNLADKILQAQRNEQLTTNHHASNNSHNVVQGKFAKRAMSMAASVAFIVGLLVGQVNWGNIVVPTAHASLAQTAIQHVIEERPFVQSLDEKVSSQQLNTKMTPFAFQFNGQFPYHVYYLNHCSFGSQNAVHMVFQGEKGKVTLFFLAQDSKQASEFSQQNMDGMIIPMDNNSMVLVGEEGEDLTSIAHKIENMMQKRT